MCIAVPSGWFYSVAIPPLLETGTCCNLITPLLITCSSIEIQNQIKGNNATAIKLGGKPNSPPFIIVQRESGCAPAIVD